MSESQCVHRVDLKKHRNKWPVATRRRGVVRGTVVALGAFLLAVMCLVGHRETTQADLILLTPGDKSLPRFRGARLHLKCSNRWDTDRVHVDKYSELV